MSDAALTCPKAIWAKRWLSVKATKFARFGLLRMVRDLLHISGHIELNQKTKAVVCIALNRAAPLAQPFVDAWSDTGSETHILLNLREI